MTSATIADFDTGPTPEEADLARAWVDQDKADELNDVYRDRLATAAAYGFAAGRVAAQREQAEAAESRIGELEGDLAAIAHIASMLHDHGVETDGGVAEAVSKVLDDRSTCASVIDILQDAGVAPPEDPDDVEDALAWAGSARAQISELEEALAKAKLGEREARAARDRLVEQVTRELRAGLKPYTLPAGMRLSELLAHVFGHLRADHKKTIEAAGAAAADAQRTIEGLRGELEQARAIAEERAVVADELRGERDEARAERDRCRTRGSMLATLLHGATRAVGSLSESVWSAVNDDGEPPF